MDNRKELAKLALAALILAASSPISGQAADMEATGILLAAGCPAHGCPAKNKPDANSYSQRDNYYNEQPYGTRDNRDQNPYTTQNSDFGRSSGYNSNYDSASFDSNQIAVMDASTSTPMTESQLLNALNPQGKAMYQSLDSEGKALALQLASQDTYRDKNLAVKEAQRRMSDKNRMPNY